MGLIQRLASRMGYERRANGDPYWENFAALRGSGVSPESAQGVATVFSCVQLIAETIATLPLHLYRTGREKAREHPLYSVVHDRPNPEMTAAEYRELATAEVLLTGNHFSSIVRGTDGQVRELWPLANVQVLRLDSGRLVYEYSDRRGTVHRLLADDVLHLRHRIGPDGVRGLSPLQVARDTFTLAQSEQQHGVSLFQNGARLSGVLESPQLLKPEQRVALRDSWQSQYGGAANSGRTPVLEAGMSYKPLGLSMADAQWVESRRFTVHEICRIYRVPPVLVGAMESANFSNSQELARQFVSLSLRRWLAMWEQGVESKCLTEAGRRQYHLEHSVEGLLRGDSSARASFYSHGIRDGWMRRSEARELENLPPIDGLDSEPLTGKAPAAPGDYPSKQ